MAFTLVTIAIAVGLFVGMLLFMELGRRLGIRRLAAEPDGVYGNSTIDAAVFAMMGLLLAFTFSGSASRFDARRMLIVEETNAIGTAYLRLDLLPAATQPPLRDLFRQYLDSRLETYKKWSDADAARQELAHSAEIQHQIWNQAIAATRIKGVQTATPVLLVPALNQMIDITTTRTMASQIHPPLVINIMLLGLELTCALLAGYGTARSRKRSWLHMVTFAGVMAAAVFVIVDIEYPRLGLIRVNAFDQALVALRNGMT